MYQYFLQNMTIAQPQRSGKKYEKVNHKFIYQESLLFRALSILSCCQVLIQRKDSKYRVFF